MIGQQRHGSSATATSIPSSCSRSPARCATPRGVDFATALMGTPANIADAARGGVHRVELSRRRQHAISCSRLEPRRGARRRRARARRAGLSAFRGSRRLDRARGRARSTPPSTRCPSANVAIVSVPGTYAALEAHKALAAGLDVLLFSDNVSIEDEIELKDHATRVGRIVMGPGAGTASIAGCGLGFANVGRPRAGRRGRRRRHRRAGGDGPARPLGRRRLARDRRRWS